MKAMAEELLKKAHNLRLHSGELDSAVTETSVANAASKIRTDMREIDSVLSKCGSKCKTLEAEMKSEIRARQS